VICASGTSGRSAHEPQGGVDFTELRASAADARHAFDQPQLHCCAGA